VRTSPQDLWNRDSRRWDIELKPNINQQKTHPVKDHEISRRKKNREKQRKKDFNNDKPLGWHMQPRKIAWTVSSPNENTRMKTKDQDGERPKLSWRPVKKKMDGPMNLVTFQLTNRVDCLVTLCCLGRLLLLSSFPFLIDLLIEFFCLKKNRS
jgi:hypothetical protein